MKYCSDAQKKNADRSICRDDGVTDQHRVLRQLVLVPRHYLLLLLLSFFILKTVKYSHDLCTHTIRGCRESRRGGV